MRQRPSSRLLVLNSAQQVLLFRFEHKDDALSGQAYWATPGGGLDEGESYEDAARRELYEEVGIQVDDLGAQIAQRTATFTLPDGEQVEADERYFIVRVGDHAVTSTNWTDHERRVMAAHRWWDQADLRLAKEQVWPEGLSEILSNAGVWTTAAK